MKPLTISLLVVLLAGCVSTDSTSAPAVNRESEEFLIETTVLATYNVLSGSAGRRDWNRFEDLFIAGGTVTVTDESASANVQTAKVLTTKEYVERLKPELTEKSWFERPVATRILRYGSIAQVWSTYEGRESTTDVQPAGRGIKSFQLVKVGNDWKVQSLVIQKEDAQHPIPTQFAPR